MRTSTIALLLVLCPLAFTAEDTGETELSYKTYRNWRLHLPAENFTKLSGELPGGFRVDLTGTKLLVDADGDGVCERTVEGKLDDFGTRHAMVTCRKGEGPVRGFRLRDEGQGWHFAPGGAAIGKLGETKLQIIDQDNDGRFDGFGTDAMVVGTGKRAMLLSEVVNIAGELYALEVAADGSSMKWTPFVGETGELDLTTDLKTEAKLLTAVVVSLDGQRSFDLANAPAGMKVPVGDYRIHSGQLGLGKATVTVKTGKAGLLTVSAGVVTRLDWGGPTHAEFAFQRRGNQVAFSPDAVWYYGSAGEQYSGWTPIGKSPEFTVTERNLGTELTKAVFPGSS
jgi:hypothetical protein